MFFVTAFSFMLLKLDEFFAPALAAMDWNIRPRMLALLLCLPAAFLGATSWWKVRTFGRTWPAALCIVIAWAGLFYGSDRADYRGLVNATYLTLVLPVAALIVAHRCWWLCARIYVLGNALALALVFCFQWQSSGLAMFTSLYRFGHLRSDDGMVRVSNPNVMGGQLALAAVLALMLYLRGASPANRDQGSTTGTGRLGLGWTVFLSLGCILTASRGAFAAWLGGMGLLFISARRQDPGKLKDMIALSAVLLSSVLFVTAATDFTPWQRLQDRFDRHSVTTIAGRIPLWRGAFDVWRSNPRYFLIGAGAGMAPKTLGRQLGFVRLNGEIAGVDCHNSFVEWGLNFGLLGMSVGLCLLLTAWRKAHQLDRRDGNANRRAVLLCFCLAATTFVALFQLSFLPAGALMLAMLSEPGRGVPRSDLKTRHDGIVAVSLRETKPHFAETRHDGIVAVSLRETKPHLAKRDGYRALDTKVGL